MPGSTARPSGRIAIGTRVVFDGASGIFVDAQFRNFGLMFQSYALWPHMTVYKNLDFTLELRRIRGAAARERIAEALALVEMEGYAERYPGELSGGQQQRVALARTLVYRPEILLLDEPLSNLDAKLRERARIWLGELQRRTGVTTVYVTHDQSEALAMSDKIIVMNGGRIAQIGTPREIYEQPREIFVADFVGASNLIAAALVTDGGSQPRAPRAPATCSTSATRRFPPGMVRSRWRSGRNASSWPTACEGPNRVAATVTANSYLGARNLLVAKIGDQSVRVETDRGVAAETVHLHFPREALSVFPAS